MLAALLITKSLVFRSSGLITMRHTQISPAEVSDDVVIRSVYVAYAGFHFCSLFTWNKITRVMDIAEALLDIVSNKTP